MSSNLPATNLSEQFCGAMFHIGYPTSPEARTDDVWLTGLTKAQEEACCAALKDFLGRHDLASWGLHVTLSEDGPQTWQLDVSAVASREFDSRLRSDRFTLDETVDRTRDLARIVDRYLEAHYNACMSARAMSQRPDRKPGSRRASRPMSMPRPGTAAH